MQSDHRPDSPRHEVSYLGSSSTSLDDEEDFIDDNSSTSTLGPPPDSPQSTGRFSRPWNLAVAQPFGSEGSSPTSSLSTRITNNRTGSFRPLRSVSHPHGANDGGQSTGSYPVHGVHGRSLSSASPSVSPTGSSIPQEFGRSFRLFNTSRYLAGGGSSSSRQREAGFSTTFRSTLLRSMDNNSAGRPSGGIDHLRETGGARMDGAVLHVHQRHSSLFSASYGNNPGGSAYLHHPALELRNGSTVLPSMPSGPANASFIGASISPLLGAPQSPRSQGFGTAALELAQYAMGGGRLIAAGVTPVQRELATVLSTLRSHLSLNGQTILVGDAAHPLEIKRGSLVGTGGFAKVYAGLNTCRGELVAIKEIQVVDADDVAALREIEQEFALLRSLRHPNIVSYHLFEHSRSQKICRIVMEFLAGDSTLHLLRKFGALSETILRRITRHLLNAVAYIHREGIFHRDIKPANILVSHKGDIKLCDFGCSKRISELSKPSSCIIGTPVYMAPELIKGEATHKADIWSMGCTLFELATGLLPWYHSGVKDNLPLMFYITTTSESPMVLPASPDGSMPEFSPEFRHFMDMCFIRDPTRRPEAAELLRHPWITGVRCQALSSPTRTAAWSPRVPDNFLCVGGESQDSATGPRHSNMSPLKGCDAGSGHDSAAALSNEDSFTSELAAVKLSLSAGVLTGSPQPPETAVEDELQCQQQLEEVSAATTLDLCFALMNFPESAVKDLERCLRAADGGGAVTGTVTPDASPAATRTFSVPSPSLVSHRGPVSVSIGDFTSPSASPEHSILHDHFCYSQAQLGASAGNFVLPAQPVEVPAQQYLRITEDGSLEFATVHEYDSDALGETLRVKSTSVDSSVVASFCSRVVSPARNSSFSRASGSPGLPLVMADRRTSPQRSAANSGYFASLRGESPVRPFGPTLTGSPLPPSSPRPLGQQGPIPPPPLVTGGRPAPLPPAPVPLPWPHPPPTASTVNLGDEAASPRTQSPTSSLAPLATSFRHLPDKAKVAADGKLHMSFVVSTSPGAEMSVPLIVDVGDVHCKLVDNQPSYFVAISDDIRSQITQRIKEAAAQSAANSPAQSTSGRKTPTRGLPHTGSSTSTLAEAPMTFSHHRALSSSSGAHFYNSPSYRASRSPARTLSHLSLSTTSVLQQQQQQQQMLVQLDVSPNAASAPVSKSASSGASVAPTEEHSIRPE